MKKINEFLTMIHLQEKPLKLWLLIVIPSVIYCVMLSFVQTLMYMGNPLIYYSALYFLILWFGFVWLIVFFQFLNKKRGNTMTLSIKSYLLPYFGVQTIFYILMMGCHYITMQIAGDLSKNFLFYILTALCILVTLAYLPWQLFCCFEILDGKRNPLRILKDGLVKLAKQYQICFYALILLAFVAVVFAFGKEMLFHIPMSFVPYMSVHDIMVNANPFADGIAMAVYAFKDVSQWGCVLYSLVYGIIMSVLLVVYYMLMACAYDEDIRIS